MHLSYIHLIKISDNPMQLSELQITLNQFTRYVDLLKIRIVVSLRQGVLT